MNITVGSLSPKLILCYLKSSINIIKKFDTLDKWFITRENYEQILHVNNIVLI